jgi:pyruvate kinase
VEDLTRTSIVCTLGPASDTASVLQDMAQAGMGLARLNFSHGTPDDHRRRALRVREVAANLGRSIFLIQDLQGPKIRTVQTPRTVLRGGDIVILGDAADAPDLRISEPSVLERVAPGQMIYIDDGLIELTALERVGRSVRCRVVIGGEIEGNQGVAFPSIPIPLPPLTEKDIGDLAIGRDIGVEWVALSFVQRWQDVELVRQHLAPGARVIAKVETAAALEDLTSIAAAADAIMIARGDLGVSIPRARVPLVQKDIIRICRQQGTVSIVATEMLLSMVHQRHPTRAEVGDVATAVVDGCNAVMLSEETAIGDFPALAVAEMREVIETVEASEYYPWPSTS